jgi:hypothetical protein
MNILLLFRQAAKSKLKKKHNVEFIFLRGLTV